MAAQRDKKKVHFATLMDICHLKNAELEPKFQKYKGRVVLRGDIVKDDSGTYADFSEQGSSASQMTAAEVMDVISSLPDCDGQAADAVSSYSQVKIGGRSQIARDTNGRTPERKLRIPWYCLNEIYTGKTIRASATGTWVYVCSENKNYFYRFP